MTPLEIILIILAVLIVGGGVFSYFYCRKVAKAVYESTLVRTSPEVWGRCCSAPENEEQLYMWNKGLEWAEANKDRMTEVETESDGFHLFGEYYDFGAKRAVIIIPGRCESLMYSYYFAPPYEEAGCNVLVIDIRSHGKSDGIYDYVCKGEDEDVLKWAELLTERFGNEQILIHGICMGAGTGVLTLTRPDCPEYFAGMISEGCYVSFYENYKRHMIEMNRPTFPVLQMVMHLIKKHTGTDVRKTKPIDYIDKVHVPFLFICGEKDPFSLPEKSRQLYEKCGSESKEIVWFPSGAHSHLRAFDEEGFDRAIVEFIHKYFD